MSNPYVHEIVIGFLFGLGAAVAFWLWNKIAR